MRRLAIALLAACLLVVSAAPAIAQSPSPEPPPWFGGRVEMPEHGFAVTLPDDWVAFDIGADIDAQVDVLESSLDGWATDVFTYLRKRYAPAAAEGAQLVATNFSGYLDYQLDPQTCSFTASPAPVPGRDLAESWHESLRADEWTTGIEPPTEVVLSAGNGWIFATDWQHPDASSLRPSTVFYVVEGDAIALWVSCAGTERPDDDWLSIAETIEFVPAEE